MNQVQYKAERRLIILRGITRIFNELKQLIERAEIEAALEEMMEDPEIDFIPEEESDD